MCDLWAEIEETGCRRSVFSIINRHLQSKCPLTSPWPSQRRDGSDEAGHGMRKEKCTGKMAIIVWETASPDCILPVSL